MPGRDGIPIHPRIRVRLIRNFLQLCSPDRLTVVSEDLEASVERCIHDGIVDVDPRIGFRDFRDGESGITGRVGASGEDRGSQGLGDREFALEEGEEVFRSAEIAVRARKMWFTCVLTRCLEGTGFVRN